jgi:hypothetical protein
MKKSSACDGIIVQLTSASDEVVPTSRGENVNTCINILMAVRLCGLLQGFTLWRRHLFLVSQSGAWKKIFFLGCSTFSSVATRILIMNGMKSDPAGSCRALERKMDGTKRNEHRKVQECGRSTADGGAVKMNVHTEEAQ